MPNITLTSLAVDETLDRLAMDHVYGGFSWKKFGIGVGIAVGGAALAATGLGLGLIALGVGLTGATIVGASWLVPLGALGAAGGVGVFGWGGYRAVRGAFAD